LNALKIRIPAKLNTQLNRDIFYNSAGSFAYCFFQYMITVLLLRVKGAEDAGVYSLAYSFTNIFTLISGFGMGNYQLSDMRGQHSDGTYIAARLCTSAAAAVCFAVSVFFTGFDRYTMLTGAALMLYKLLEGLSGVYLCVVQKAGDYRTIAVSNCAKAVFPFAAFCAGLYFFGLVWALAAMSLAYFMVFTLFDYPRVTGSPAFTARVAAGDIVKVLLPSFILVLQGLCYTGMTFFTRYVINGTYSTEELGYFSSITLLMLVVPIFSAPVLSVFIPGLSGLYADGKFAVIRRMTFRMGVCVIGGTAALCLSSLVWGRFALVLVFGERIAAYLYILMPTLAASGFMLGVGVLTSILTAMQKRVGCLVASAAAMLTAIASCPALVGRFYMNGANYALILAFTVQGIISLAMLLYHLRERKA
jgi:O-antigen/teichoic acid export membrane protein